MRGKRPTAGIPLLVKSCEVGHWNWGFTDWNHLIWCHQKVGSLQVTCCSLVGEFCAFALMSVCRSRCRSSIRRSRFGNTKWIQHWVYRLKVQDLRTQDEGVIMHLYAFIIQENVFQKSHDGPCPKDRWILKQGIDVVPSVRMGSPWVTNFGWQKLQKTHFHERFNCALAHPCLNPRWNLWIIQGLLRHVYRWENVWSINWPKRLACLTRHNPKRPWRLSVSVSKMNVRDYWVRTPHRYERFLMMDSDTALTLFSSPRRVTGPEGFEATQCSCCIFRSFLGKMGLPQLHCLV